MRSDHPLHETLLTDGFVRIEDALDPTFCDDIVERVLHREAISASDASTWAAEPRHCPVVENWSFEQIAPRAVDTLTTLVGGDEAIRFAGIQDNLIVNFPRSGVVWEPPSGTTGNWHKDGDWFRHFLDSPEQALLVIVFWRDVTERQGPTVGAVDSIPPVARLLAEHPEGMDPAELRTQTGRIVRSCRDLRPLTGRQGTVLLAHPFLLHTASPNTTGDLRIISNSSVMLRNPMRFDRTDTDHTPVEQSILSALDLHRLEFHPAGERSHVTSARERRWKTRATTKTGTDTPT